MHKELTQKIIAFRDARDWAQYHTPENLSKAISIEAAELLEHFIWKDPVDQAGLEDELADILMYCFIFAHKIGVDPLKIMEDKLKRNEQRFPVDTVKGTSGRLTRVEHPNQASYEKLEL